jgi:hypothetical protein
MSVLLGLFAPAGYGILHGILSRSRALRTWPPQKAAALSCALGLALEVVAWLSYLGLSLPAAGFALVVSGATAHVYFHIFNMSETARRIRVLVAALLGRAPLSTEPAKIGVRLERLVALGEIRREGETYRSRNGLLTHVASALVAYEKLIFPSRFKPLRE